MNPDNSKPPLLTTSRASRSSVRRILTVIGVFVAVGIVMLVALFVGFQATKKDTAKDYRLLCGCLMEQLPADGVAEVQPTKAEIEARIPLAKQASDRMSWRTRRLAPIARDFSSLIRHAETLQKNAPRLSSIVFGSAEAALGLYAGQRATVNEGGQKALKATENLWDAYVALKKIMDERQLLAVKLANLASQFSGPETNSPAIAFSFAEHKPTFFDLQTREQLVITNTSGQTLNDCIVAVQFSGDTGKSCLNLYFTPEWPANEKRSVKYSDFDFPEDTVDNIVRVDVRFWSKECSLPKATLKKSKLGWADLK